jgi:predicted transcriptional regulator
LSQRLGLSERQVQRYVAELEKAGLVRRVQRHGHNGGKLSNTYDLAGLVAKLKELEPDFREVREAAKAARANVSKPGYRNSKPRANEKVT